MKTVFILIYFSEFQPACETLLGAVQERLGYIAQDVGLMIRGATLTSNFCPTFPVVHNFILYVQTPGDEDFDNFNTHDSRT